MHCFGPHLIRLDVRQESGRHTRALSELTQTLALGDYQDWSEDQRLEWLRGELANPRPLIPAKWNPSEETREVFDTLGSLPLLPDGHWVPT